MHSHSLRQIQSRLTSWLSQKLGVDVSSIDAREKFSHYGIDSLAASELLTEIGKELGRRLSASLLWEYPTPETLARFLIDGATAQSRTSGPARPVKIQASSEEPIAIIGMSCRFPRAPSVRAFWQLLCDGTDAITEAPKERWDAAALYDPDIFREGKMNTRRGGFLDQVDGFDPLFFGISPKEAIHIDPQQRLMLELSHEALEDAGIPAEALKESRTGVYFGMMWFDYPMLIHYGGLRGLTQHTATGYHHSCTPNRVSYFLGLQGPSMAIDSACSSALVAAYLGCESLRRGESTLALVGGVNLNILPDSTLVVSKMGALSPDGRCYTFDARANGYVRGEGGGVVALKLLSRAIADKDPIRCIIRGYAVNNDGPSNGFSAPNPRAHERMLREAYAHAGLPPSAVDYVELHGTGTPIGDAIEASALGRVLCAERAAEQPLLVGSVKTNIGHLEAAAGVAGLIKAALCLEHRALAPSLNYQTRNPHIPEELSLQVQTTPAPWPEREHAATAGVSSFGLGGTNAHVVLQEAAPPRAELFTLSADSAEELRAIVKDLLTRIVQDGACLSLSALHDLTSAQPQDRPHRLAIPARSVPAVRRALEGYLADRMVPGSSYGSAKSGIPPRPVFVFSGQGSQWQGMGRSLLRQEPLFRAELERCSRLIEQHLGWSLLDELLVEAGASRLDHIEVSWPAIVSIEIALTRLLDSWGARPAVVIGHSNGEVAAAAAASLLSREDALQIACTQGRVMESLHGQGSMGLVELDWDQAGQAISAYPGRLHRAIEASPDSTVLSGEPGALLEVFAALQKQGVFCRQIKVDVAGHSPQIEPLDAALLEGMRGIRTNPASVPIFSLATLRPGTPDDFPIAHWIRHLSAPVYFSKAITELIAGGHDLFVEIAPHSIVRSSIESIFKRQGRSGTVLGTLLREEDERECLLQTLGRLYTQGLPIGDPSRQSSHSSAAKEELHVLPLSARCEESLNDLARLFSDELARTGSATLHDIAYTAGVRRSHYEHRLAVVGESKEEVALALAAYGRGEPAAGSVTGRISPGTPPKLAFIFSGQGSQWLGMGVQLLRTEPAFRRAFFACDDAVMKEAGWSPLRELLADRDSSRLDRIERVQPLLVSLQISLAALWRSFGVEPDAVVGHSMGEVAAAQVCGALSLEDAIRVICRRSSLMQRLSGRGGMALVARTLAEAEADLAGMKGRLAIAASNGPSSTVLSGEVDSLDPVLARLEAQGIYCRRVQVDVASHSPLMDALRDDLLVALDGILPARPRLPMHSTVTGNEVGEGSLGAAYWFSNLRERVSFWPVIQKLRKAGYGLFVEVSPHPLLVPALEDGARSGVALGTLRRDQPERRALLESLAALYAQGYPVQWSRLFHEGGVCVALPTYPFRRERYWFEPPAPTEREPIGGRAPGRMDAAPSHPLLGSPFSAATQPESRFWEQRLSIQALPYLMEHQVHGSAVFPGSGYIEMALAAARDLHRDRTLELRQLRFERMLGLTEGTQKIIQTVLTEEEEDSASFQICSQEGRQWVRHAQGTLRRAPKSAPFAGSIDELREIRERCGIHQIGAAYYRHLSDRQLQYGPAFQGVQELWIGAEEVLARIAPTEAVRIEHRLYGLHPAWLDACFHASLSATCIPPSATFVPIEIEQLQVYADGDREIEAPIWVHARVKLADDSLTVDLQVLSQSARPLLVGRGLRLKRLQVGASPQPETQASALYDLVWRPQALARPLPEVAPRPGSWLLFMDKGGTSAAVHRALEQSAGPCIQVYAGERFERLGKDRYSLPPGEPAGYAALLRDALGEEPRCAGVLHLWSLDAAPAERLTPQQLERDQELGCLSALFLTQALLQRGMESLPRLFLVTRGTQAVLPTDTVPYLSQSTLSGLGRAIEVEHPELLCTRIDLGASADAAELAALVDELRHPDKEKQIALRSAQRHVARLVRRSETTDRAPGFRFRPDATYLITGGLHGIGLVTAERAITEGARHLLLLGRSAPDGPAREAIAQMAAAGAVVLPVRCDVSRFEEVEATVQRCGVELPPLRGVIHGAAVLDDRILLSQGTESLRRVLLPKMSGAWNLHLATQTQPLDFFVCYSSAASLFGVLAQANYVCANAFLDAFAHHRQRAGLRCLSINWGAFSEAGIVARSPEIEQRLLDSGMPSMTPAEGMQILARLLGTSAAQVGVARLDARKWLAAHPGLAGSPYFSELLISAHISPPSTGPASEKWYMSVLAAPQEERQRLVQQRLGEHLSKVLRLSASRIDPEIGFVRLGLDSMMATDLRIRLDADLHITVPIPFLLQGASITTLVAYLVERVPDGAAPEEGLDEIEEGVL